MVQYVHFFANIISQYWVWIIMPSSVDRDSIVDWLDEAGSPEV